MCRGIRNVMYNKSINFHSNNNFKIIPNNDFQLVDNIKLIY